MAKITGAVRLSWQEHEDQSAQGPVRSFAHARLKLAGRKDHIFVTLSTRARHGNSEAAHEDMAAVLAMLGIPPREA